ncbi:MAG: vWA domain-containing protein [Solirubrobacteraceae bacterium]
MVEPSPGAFALETVVLDLPATAAAFARRLRDAGLPVGPDRAARFAQALAVARPIARRRLYWIARSVFVSDQHQGAAFEAVFREVFGSRGGVSNAFDQDAVAVQRDAGAPTPEADVQDSAGGRSAGEGGVLASAPRAREVPDARVEDVPVPVLASGEEVIRSKRFEALDRHELRQLERLMRGLSLAPPPRRTRRYEHRRRGRAIDLRRTLRASLRSGGDPIRLARRQRRVTRRRIVLLCDISGSMEPYARAYVQFLACAARVGPRAEAFVFATRLTRLTRALAVRSPERALARAAVAAPDWSSGTRIGEALKTFNDRHGRRGMARGAVVVILSDGWERGDPSLVGREMERLGRLAHRIVWVNPRVAARGFSPRTGGMAAALPHCDALLSGHNLEALEAVVAAIGGDRRVEGAAPEAWIEPETSEEDWASATPVAGSSVAMPSGYGPSRERRAPGWGRGDSQ